MKNAMLTVRGLPTHNEFIAANNKNRYVGAQMKKVSTEAVAWAAKEQLKPVEGVCEYMFIWNEPNKKRDPDNIAFAKKFIMDGLIMAGIIPNDGWQNVGGFIDRFVHHKGVCAYVEVRIHEVKR